MKSLLPPTLLTLGLAALACPLFARQSPCPHDRATRVAERAEATGPLVECGVQIRLFGISATLRTGPLCPESRVVYPAHGECRGEHAWGLRCAFRGSVSVYRERCSCTSTPILGDWVALVECDCEVDGVAAHVSDATTEPCG